MLQNECGVNTIAANDVITKVTIERKGALIKI
jgi:hypothetical protein